jgi:hypothetical protein
MSTATATSILTTASGTASGITYDAFVRLLRSTPQALDAYFGEIGVSTMIASTQATVHCRYLKLDGNNQPRVKDLADRLAEELINYAIPRSDIEAARTKGIGPHDAKHYAALYRRANRLFTDLEKTGEGGELLLYLMTETYLKIPQLFCKMPLKTSSQMHYHGADGIHGTLDPGNGTLSLYWGESKLYDTASSAIDACIESLAPFVLPSGGSTAPQARDIQLLKDGLDLNNQALEQALLKYLDRDDPAYNKLTYRGVALVGFDADCYAPGSGPLSEVEIAKALTPRVSSWHGSVSHYVGKHKLSQIGIELFCIPFPSVEAFREAFLKELRIK